MTLIHLGVLLQAVAFGILLSAQLVQAGDDLPEEIPPWAGNAEATALITSGNTSTQTYGLGAELQHKPGRWTYKAKGSYLRNTNRGALSAETVAADLRTAYAFNYRFDGIGQYQFLRNRFAGIIARNAWDAGASYRILPRSPHLLRAELAFGYITENRTQGEFKEFATARAGLQYTWKLSATAELSDDLTFIESLKDSEDWRLTNVLAITTRLTDPLSLKVSYSLFYLNRPVPGFKNTDTTTAVALVAKF